MRSAQEQLLHDNPQLTPDGFNPDKMPLLREEDVPVLGTLAVLPALATPEGQAAIRAAVGDLPGNPVDAYTKEEADDKFALKGAGGAAASFLELVGTPAICVKEVQLPAATQISAVRLGDNAAGVTFQVDTATRVGTRAYGAPNQTQAQANALLAALSPADYESGVSLSARVGAANTFVMRVQASLSLASSVLLSTGNVCDLLVFPGQIAGGLLKNGNFDTGYAADRTTGWVGGLTYDATNKVMISTSTGEKYLEQNIPAVKKGVRYRLEIEVQNLPVGTPATGGISVLTLLDYNDPITSGPGKFYFDFTPTQNLAGSILYVKCSGFIGAIKRVEILPLQF